MQMLVVYAKDLKEGFANYAEPVSWEESWTREGRGLESGLEGGVREGELERERERALEKDEGEREGGLDVGGLERALIPRISPRWPR